MKELRNTIFARPVRTVVILAMCVAVNLLGKYIAAYFSLPLWLDAFGTIFAAYVLGPVGGAVAGGLGNVIFAQWNVISLVYALVSIYIGISAGLMARKGWFESLFEATTLAGVVTLGSVILSTVLNLAFYEGSTGNIWGDGVKDYLSENGLNTILAAAIGEAYLDFLDKVVTVICMYCLIKILRKLKSPGRKRSALISALLVVFIFTVGVLSPIYARADSSEKNISKTAYIQQVYNASNGLPCGQANDIVSARDGILWVGSYSGLYRYNGNEFRFMDEFETVKNVNCLYTEGDNDLWIGTNDNGLVLAVNGEAADTLDATEGLPADSVRSIEKSSDGEYYIGTADKMAVVSRDTDGTLTVDGLIPEVCYAQDMSADGSGHVAAVTSDGGLFIMGGGKVLYTVDENEASSDAAVSFSSCTFDEDGLLYAGAANGMVYIYSVGDSKSKLKDTCECEGVSTINRIFFHDDEAWVLADNGIGIIQDGMYQNEETGDFNSAVANMAVDYQDNLWFASTRHGLLQLSRSNFPNISTAYGLNSVVVNSTALKDSELYIGTDDGLDIVDLYTGNILENDLTELFKETRVRCIEVDSSGNIWVCSYGKGLARLSPQGDIKVYDIDDYSVGEWVRCCMELSDGNMAVSADGGFTILDADTQILNIPYGDELGSSQILSMCELTDGSILLGTDGNGIVTVKDGVITAHSTKEDGLSSGVILRIVPDGDTDGYFLVTSNGLCYMKDGEISTLSNFPYSNNYDIVLDDDGETFVLGSAGIYVVDRDALVGKKELSYTLIDSTMGLLGALTANSWDELDDEGYLYLSTDRGVIRMNIDAYKYEQRAYRIMIPEVIRDGEPYLMGENVSVTVAREVKTVEFVPEIVNFSLEDPYVSYYLEGIDTGYKTVYQSELGNVVYTNIPPGQYNFHLAVMDKETGETVEETVLYLTKEKAIYDNTWFIVYMLAVGGLFVGWFAWFVTRLYTRREMLLQQERLSLALQQAQMGNETILAIAKTVDAKDVRTSRHSQRVSEYSVMIAREYGFSEKEQDNLRNAALLHDIGKIGIPDAILNKPARLTDEEYEIMKTHVTRGGDILKGFTLVEHVVEGARYHHERYDGTGYPDGLKAQEIPIYGRIIAIADAFDAMTANRVYRKRQDFSYVMDELHKGRGTQFDPELLDIFLKLIDDGEIDIKALYSGNDQNEEGAKP